MFYCPVSFSFLVVLRTSAAFTTIIYLAFHFSHRTKLFVSTCPCGSVWRSPPFNTWLCIGVTNPRTPCVNVASVNKGVGFGEWSISSDLHNAALALTASPQLTSSRRCFVHDMTAGTVGYSWWNDRILKYGVKPHRAHIVWVRVTSPSIRIHHHHGDHPY